MKTVGILALQGDFDAHRKALKQAGAHPVLVRTAEQFHEIDGLIIPGGESTTMLNLLHRQNLYEPLRAFGAQKPILGTCAGVILMCTKVQNPAQESLGLMDLTVERNGYGRQIDSSVHQIDPSREFIARTSPGQLEAVFIRAPVIQATGPGVTILAEYRDRPILVEQNGHIGATFHPELAGDARVHQLFLSKL
jgi:5'-phosphate synthase pdxT subunit